MWLLVGCNDPIARERTAWRQERIRGWIDTFGTREVERAEIVRREMDEIKRLWHRDVERFSNNLGRIEAWNRSADRRWRERQPAYLRAIEKQFEGDLPHACRTALIMFF